jgi:hypothetical protein
MFRLGTTAALVTLICALILCRTMTGRAEDIPKYVPWKIDEEAAQKLAAEANGPRYELNLFNYDAAISFPFFVFNGLGGPPSEGGFGFFAVNPWTGDVWALWGCHKMSTPALRKSQAEIRKRFAPEELKRYAELSRLKPDCIVETP